jgi:hypothetical protein
MNQKDLALDYYKISRTEINEHIKLQTQSILFFVSAVSVVFGLVIKDGVINKELALLIPFMCLCFSVIVLQRDFFIFSIASYCKNELEPFMRLDMENPPLAWDSSISVRVIQKWVSPVRSVAHALILTLPGVYSLIINYTNIGVTWWFGIFSLVLIGLMQCSIIYLRVKKKT